MKKGFAFAVVLVMVAGLLTAGELSGSDYVRMGTLGSLEGTLREEKGEWYLEAKGVTYEVHLGNYQVLYPEGIGLKNSDTAKVRGFIYEDQVSAVSISTRGGTWQFRDDSGRPLWAGRGRGENANNPEYVHD